MTTKCKNCINWKSVKDGEHAGECRAHPPAVVADTVAKVWETVWPETYPNEWCGEGKEAEDE